MCQWMNRPLFSPTACVGWYDYKVIKGTPLMSAFSFYRVEIDMPETEIPIVYFRKVKRCSTAKGMDRQHNRMVNEACDAWRQYDFKRLTVSRVPAEEVVPA